MDPLWGFPNDIISLSQKSSCVFEQTTSTFFNEVKFGLYLKIWKEVYKSSKNMLTCWNHRLFPSRTNCEDNLRNFLLKRNSWIALVVCASKMKKKKVKLVFIFILLPYIRQASISIFTLHELRKSIKGKWPLRFEFLLRLGELKSSWFVVCDTLQISSIWIHLIVHV